MDLEVQGDKMVTVKDLYEWANENGWTNIPLCVYVNTGINSADTIPVRAFSAERKSCGMPNVIELHLTYQPTALAVWMKVAQRYR